MKCKKMRQTLLIVIGALPLLVTPTQLQSASAEPFQHSFGELREYNDKWLSVCPNKFQPDSKVDYFRDCWTSTFTGRPGFHLNNRFAVSRNRTTGQLGITFVQDKKLDKRKPLFVRFEDADENQTMLRFDFGKGWEHRPKTINEYRLTNPQDVKKFVDLMKTSQTVTFFLPRLNGDEEVEYSLSGFNEGLAFTEKYATPQS